MCKTTSVYNKKQEQQPSRVYGNLWMHVLCIGPDVVVTRHRQSLKPTNPCDRAPRKASHSFLLIGLKVDVEIATEIGSNQVWVFFFDCWLSVCLFYFSIFFSLWWWFSSLFSNKNRFLCAQFMNIYLIMVNVYNMIDLGYNWTI